MKISVTSTINSAHHLPGTELHGHTYRITATACPGADGLKDGMVMPFHILKDALLNLTTRLDHKRLELVIGKPATAERLALWIRDRMGFPGISVRVEVGDDGSVETD